MADNKLFKYLSVLQENEWNSLESFLRMTYSSRNDVMELFKYIKKNRKKITSKKLSTGSLNRTLAPHLNRKSFQNILSKLSLEIEEYWIYYDIKSNRDEWNTKRILALNRRGLFDQANSAFRAYQKKYNTKNRLSIWKDYYYHLLTHSLMFSNNPIRDSREYGQSLLLLSIKAIQRFYRNIIIFQVAEAKNRMHVLKESWPQEIIRLPESVHSDEIDLLEACLSEQLGLIDSNYQAESDLLHKTILDQDIEIAPRLALTFYYRLRRKFITKARSNKIIDEQNLVQLIQWSVKSNLVLFDGVLDIQRFISDIKILCTLNNSDYALAYRKDFLKYVVAKVQQEAKILSDIIISFSLNDYDRVCKSYITTSFKDFRIKLDASSYYLRASYEQFGQDKEYFEPILKNFASFLNRNKRHFSSTVYEGEKNFYHILKLLINQHNIVDIRNELQSKNTIFGRAWLLDKIQSRPN